MGLLKKLTKGFKMAADPFGAAKGLLGGSSGPSGQADVLATLQAGLEQSRLGTLQAQATQRAALPIVQKAYGSTRQNLAQSAERTKRNLMRDTYNPALQRVDALGMGASSLAPLAQRGVLRDQARLGQEIDSMLAQQLGPLALGEANATAGILGQNAGLGMQGLGLQNDVRSQLAQAYGRPKRRKKGLLDLVGAAAPIIGMISGNPLAGLGALGGSTMTPEGDDGGA